jgi:hypothetical protein
MGTDGEHVNPAVQQGLRVSRACHLTHLPGANSVVGVQDTQLNAPVGFLVKEQMLCLCEGGKGCSRENPAKQKAGNAIKGLHSNWVGDKVLAMARPWQDNISKHKLLEQFKEHNIGLIVNLQEVGVVQQVDPKKRTAAAAVGPTRGPAQVQEQQRISKQLHHVQQLVASDAWK